MAGDQRSKKMGVEGTTDVLDVAGKLRKRLKDLCECDNILDNFETQIHGGIAEKVNDADDNVSSSDEIDEILESESNRLNNLLDLFPADTHSLTLMSPKLPTCVKYGVRSGLTHHKMSKFSPLSRGLQGAAIAIAAFATTSLIKARCWNEVIIDQIVDDGDTYYCESYNDERRHTDNRRTLTILDLNGDFMVQKTHRVYVKVEEPVYVGTFRSTNPTDLHIAKALELFFERYDAGVLVSSALNIAVWRDAKYFNIFDGQARRNDLSVLMTTSEDNGGAKLILVRDLTGVLFVILEKSQVQNQHFVIYGLSIRGIEKLATNEEDPEEPEKSVGKPLRRPSGYKIPNKYRALVRGSFHLAHKFVPEELRTRGHLIVALAALIYARLIPANKWTSAMIDLILNQSHIYLIDLARFLDKPLDDTFELKIEDAVGDVLLGIYAAKINTRVNVVPGQGKKGKATIDTGFRDFFATNNSGILEIKKVFYAIWKDGEKYYFFDPFGCDDEGFRVDPTDPENTVRYENSRACVTMNSSVNELIETILENTDNKEKDPFIIHGLDVLYVKAESNGRRDTVIYRQKKVNRRPLAASLPQEASKEPDDCEIVVDPFPKPRADAEITKDISLQYPEPMTRVEDFTMREDEPATFVQDVTENTVDPGTKESNEPREADNVDDSEGSLDENLDAEILAKSQVEVVDGSNEETPISADTEENGPRIRSIIGYRMINPRRLVLHGSDNCLADEFTVKSRGRQGLSLALAALAYAKIKTPGTWRNIDVDQILRVGDAAHADIVNWIRQGSPGGSEEEDNDEEGANEDDEEDEEEEEEEEDEEAGDDDEGAAPKSFKAFVKPTPSHLDLSMLPVSVKFGDNRVTFLKKQSVIDGVADPLANLGEALERYFDRYNEVILENKRLAYGIWKQDDKYFLLNPYGGDEEGWRCRDYPACLVVTDTINELVDLSHGLLEFNDQTFSLHFVGVESIQPGDKYVAPFPLELPVDFVEKYKTRFLPITDEDLFQPELDSEAQPIDEETKVDDKKQQDDEDEDDEDEEDEDEEDEEEGEEKDEDEEVKTRGIDMAALEERIFEDPLLEIEEQEIPDAPQRLNLSLLTQSVNIDDDTIEINAQNETTRLYERLKYKHPPPYVLPPEKVLCVLLEAKKASGSMHSLVSRFSIDSRLAVKAAITDFPGDKATANAIVSIVSSKDEGKASRMIKLPPSKYLFSRIAAIGAYTPLRAINEKFIQDEEIDRAREQDCRGKKKAPEETMLKEIPEDETTRPIPLIIPLGPTIKTPTPKRKSKGCGSGKSKIRECRISEYPQELREDTVLQKILCNTENVLFNMIFPKSFDNGEKIVQIDDSKLPEEVEEADERDLENNEDPVIKSANGAGINETAEESSDMQMSEIRGFIETDNDIGIIIGNSSLKNRNLVITHHFKECLFSAILCIIGKIGTNVHEMRGSVLDQFVLAAEKIGNRTGKLRYKPTRCFLNIVVLGAKCNVIMKQTNYADPENCETDELSIMLEAFLEKNQTGILALENATYAFWRSNDRFYIFDPYSCDTNGRANDNGTACLLEFCELDDMIQRIRDNNAGATENPYRLYSLSIAHMETIGRESKSGNGRKWRRRRRRLCAKKIVSVETIVPEESAPLDEKIERQVSLIELPEWVIGNEQEEIDKHIVTKSFEPMKHLDASFLVVPVVENDITRPERAPLKKSKVPNDRRDSPPRKKPYDRRFKEETCIGEPIDLCIIAWSCVHDPNLWGWRTIRGIYEASKELTYDSLLVAEDTNSAELVDGLLGEYEIGNYSFRAIFAPLHHGRLYAEEGWNLAMSLKKFLEIPIYSGATLICEKAHIGMMKRGENYYAWWTIKGTKNLRIVSCRSASEFLKVIVEAIGEIEPKDFVMRIVTISYARKLDPDCCNVHLCEINNPIGASSLARRIRPNESYDLDAVFRSTTISPNGDGPVVISGDVALDDRDTITEPRVKRCYFVALVSIMIKRDIIQSPMPAMIDRVIHVADNLYRQFNDANYHTEHVLRNVTLMNRLFDFRDCASSLHVFRSGIGKTDFYPIVRKQLRRHFVRHTDGLAQFTNCCYGFWYSRANNAYYYVDPYRCNDRGFRSKSQDENEGGACLFVCSSICQMAKQWCVNRYRETTGFFIHRIHVESIDVVGSCDGRFNEDPMWVYLDYHWSFRRWKSPNEAIVNSARDEQEKSANPCWKNYTIEVPNLIYSVWGTIGSYDARFGNRAGHNRDGICIVASSMRFLCHPSRWGAAVLDSSVICGDSYFTESIKNSARRGSRYPNPLNLQPCLKIHPHTWQIEFLPDTCGILYGGSGPDLATSLKMALDTIEDDSGSMSLIVQCENVSLAVLSCDDGFYVIDPCWIGPPLFAKNHGAIYALRCRNLNALVYAITKIINTNQRVEFRVTPIALRFNRDLCSDIGRNKRRILADPVGKEPGIVVDDSVVSRGITQPDEDSYFVYRRNLRAGISQLDNEEESLPISIVNREPANSLSISANWHLNLGKDNPKKRSLPLYDSSIMEPCRRRGISVDPSLKGPCSIDDKIRSCDDYPRTIDLAADKVTRSTKILTRRRDIIAELPLTKPLDCLPPRQFLSEKSRREFRRSNKEMADDAYKTRKHGVTPELKEEETGDESFDVAETQSFAEAPIEETDQEAITDDQDETIDDQEPTIDEEDA